jgi:3',5'-cyclic AMP phosphodiesterase CpdA
MARDSMLIAQFSDLHVTFPGAKVMGVVDTAQRLRDCIQSLLALDPRPDLLLLTGDLVDKYDPAEYAHLRELMKSVPIPFRVMPGNHDRRAALRAAFPDHPYLGVTGPINYVVEREGMRILALDSVIEGEDRGELGSATREWLAARLAEARDTPTVIAVHHPPIPTGARMMDGMGLCDADALGALVASNPQIHALLSGHIHRAMAARWHGTQVVVCPSTAHTLHLELAPEAEIHYRLEPPAFCVHRWDGKLLVTHVVQGGDYGKPHQYT